MPIEMNPFDSAKAKPNFWLSCLTVNKDAMCKQVRDDSTALYIKEPGKTCPTEILATLEEYNAEGRPIWKPMHLQPYYSGYDFVTAQEQGNVGEDIFRRGLCLPSDNKMTPEEQDIVIAIVRSCFQ